MQVISKKKNNKNNLEALQGGTEEEETLSNLIQFSWCLYFEIKSM